VDGTPIAKSTDGGIKLRTVQPMNPLGNHGGAPAGTDRGPIDKPWSFFGNTGQHFQPNGTISADPVAGAVGRFLSVGGEGQQPAGSGEQDDQGNPFHDLSPLVAIVVGPFSSPR
jgi:hypothetical protein